MHRDRRCRLTRRRKCDSLPTVAHAVDDNAGALAPPDSPGRAIQLRPSCPRAVVVLALLVGGFVGARESGLDSPLAWSLVAASGCLVGVLTRGLIARVGFGLAVVALGGVWWMWRLEPGERRWPWSELAATTLIEVSGIAHTPPTPIDEEISPLSSFARRGERWRVQMAVESVAGRDGPQPARGLLRIAGDGKPPEGLRVGDRFRALGRYEPVRPAMNPGESDSVAFAAMDGVVGSLALGTSTVVIEPLDGPRAAVRRWRASAATRAMDLLVGRSEATPARAMLAAMVLGETSSEESAIQVRQSFQHLGLSHLLAISGFHLVVLAGVALLGLRLVGDLGRWEPILVVAVLALYLAILPFNAPVWRSAIMLMAVLGSQALGRRYDPLAILAWTAVALLLYRPLDAWSLGFQLSFGLVAALIVLAPKAHEMLWGMEVRGLMVPRRSRFAMVLRAGVEGLKRLASVGVLCWAVSLPVIVYTTGLVSVLAVPVGIVAVPVVSLLLGAAYAVIAVGLVVPPVGGALGDGLLWGSQRVLDGLAWLEGAPGAWFLLPRVSLAWCIAATVAAGTIVWMWPRVSRRFAFALVAGVMAWAAIEVSLSARLGGGTRLRIDTLAVGDGTCHLVRSADEALLWDAGSLENGPMLGRRMLPRALRSLGAWRVPTAVITHANLDHFNMLVAAREQMGLRRVLVSGTFLDRARQRAASAEAYVVDRLGREGVEFVEVSAGDRVQLGEVELRFIWPPRGERFGNDNDSGLVAKVTPIAAAPGATADALLTGDVQAGAIERIRAAHPRLRARMMEAPHHGSAKETAMAWIVSIAPEVVVQSTGPSRAGDPRLDGAKAGRTWWTTAMEGAAWVELGRDGRLHTGSFRAAR